MAVFGTLLIASTYGLARFGVGLFAPRLVAERPGLEPVIGSAAAAQFVSYAVAAAVAVRLTDRTPRLGLALAGVTAAAGCLGVAVATTPWGFVASVFLGGMGAGFASPALVRVVDATVSGRAASTTQALVNTGTAAGVMVAGLLTFATATTAPPWVLMALLCAAAAGGVLLLLHRAENTSRPATRDGRLAQDRQVLVAPAAAALVVGAGSALIWTFGPLIATRTGPVAEGRVGWLWIALGLGGLAGPVTGLLVERLGLLHAWTLCACVLAASDLVLVGAIGTQTGWAAYVAVAVFGAGYMCLSGVLILWARTVWPEAAGAATSVLFIALAVGQAIGSAGFDAAQRHAGPTTVTLAAAVLCAASGAMRRR